VICIGGWDEAKESLISLIQPALAWGLSVLLVDAPSASVGRGRFGMTAFLMGSVDYLADGDNAFAHPVALYGVNAGASFASVVAGYDDRVRTIAGDFSAVDGLRTPAIVRSFIGSKPSTPNQSNGSNVAEQAAMVIDTSAEMTAADIFGRIAKQMASDRK
jgi:hypothetical protein